MVFKAQKLSFSNNTSESVDFFKDISEDELLLNLIRKEDYTAFRSLFYKYTDRLIRFALCYVSDKQSAEEIVLDIFTYLWQNRNEVEIYSLKSYLFQATKNKSLSYLREKGNVTYLEELEVSELEVSNNFNIEFEELQKLIEEAIGLLPDRCREIFLQSREIDKSNKEIAADLNISEKTVENQITIAIKKIKSHLNNVYK